jgi:hypothetical protein
MWKVGRSRNSLGERLKSKQEMQELDISAWEVLLERKQPNSSRKQVGAVTA